MRRLPREALIEGRSAELHSAVSQNCILQTADRFSVLERFDTLPIANRRYSRVQLCATRVAVFHASCSGAEGLAVKFMIACGIAGNGKT
jgi:hypothetical protein